MLAHTHPPAHRAGPWHLVAADYPTMPSRPAPERVRIACSASPDPCRYWRPCVGPQWILYPYRHAAPDRFCHGRGVANPSFMTDRQSTTVYTVNPYPIYRL